MVCNLYASDSLSLNHQLTHQQVSKLRRLIADHADLHNNELPPNYLFSATDNQHSDDLSQFVVMLAGPHGTPYSAGLWRLQLRIPEDYPVSPPKAAFKTRIWHPNVEESTGAVCVDTLKRDWDAKLTLRDILVVSYGIPRYWRTRRLNMYRQYLACSSIRIQTRP